MFIRVLWVSIGALAASCGPLGCSLACRGCLSGLRVGISAPRVAQGLPYRLTRDVSGVISYLSCICITFSGVWNSHRPAPLWGEININIFMNANIYVIIRESFFLKVYGQ